MELFELGAICLDLKAKTKDEALDEMIALLSASGTLADSAAYKQAILAREAQSPTGIGFGIAIPHAKSAAVKKPLVAFGVSKNGVDFGGGPANLIFMIAASNDAGDLHLQTLAKLSRKLINPVFRESLLQTPDKESALLTLRGI